MLSWLLALRPSVILAAICVVAVSLAVVSRNWSCRRPPPPVTMVDGFQVLGAANGAALQVRSNVWRVRTLTVALRDVGAPIDGPLAELSRANLERLAGATIRVETQRRRFLVRADGTTEDTENTEGNEEELPEAGAPLIGVVYGASGCCLQIEQLRAGLARLVPGAREIPKTWRDAENEARKAKRGIWGQQTFQPQRHQGHEEKSRFCSTQWAVGGRQNAAHCPLPTAYCLPASCPSCLRGSPLSLSVRGSHD